MEVLAGAVVINCTAVTVASVLDAYEKRIIRQWIKGTLSLEQIKVYKRAFPLTAHILNRKVKVYFGPHLKVE